MKFSEYFSTKSTALLLLGAAMIAVPVGRSDSGRFAVTFAASFLLLSLIYIGFQRRNEQIRKTAELHTRIVEQLAAARELSLSDARDRALRVLLREGKYRVVEEPAPHDLLSALGPVLQEFFARFESVTEIRGETILDRTKIAPASVREGFLKIGTDMERTEIVSEPGSDVIYILDGSEPKDSLPDEGFPTVYHFLLVGYTDSERT